MALASNPPRFLGRSSQAGTCGRGHGDGETMILSSHATNTASLLPRWNNNLLILCRYMSHGEKLDYTPSGGDDHETINKALYTH